MQCRFCEGRMTDSGGDMIDHLRMDHPTEVENEELPAEKHYTDPTFAKARQIVERWRTDG